MPRLSFATAVRLRAAGTKLPSTGSSAYVLTASSDLSAIPGISGFAGIGGSPTGPPNYRADIPGASVRQAHGSSGSHEMR
ncbi:hypothetical protein C6P88_16430 [Burkholderia contaminans]|nr:hypothetical protein C6P88_16430 [Burkholderia contaminans]